LIDVTSRPNDDVNADPMPDTQPNAGATRVIDPWTPEEDAKLTSAVANTSKKKYGKEYKTNWAAVAALVPGRTKDQCKRRWHNTFNPSITLTAGRTGKWEEDEDSKLKDAAQLHDEKDWVVISAQVPGRTRNQCYVRWQYLGS
jgi:hypothetical protein